ncbi:patatin-like phospholipase family protein [Craterilacuibacter sp.]|uniref:patatin-like phospholipase family protein n=1 Tax=Craterilacuibacter sp. TaxID=2870909 RepID=UPI003F33DB16
MKLRCFLFFSIFLPVLSLPAVATPLVAPRIGVVLGGGGARGFAHLGVLQELEKLHIPISCIAGTSAGSLIGGIYASGVPLSQLEQTFARTDWDLLTSGKPPRADVPYIRKREDTRNYLDLTVGLADGKLRLPRGAINSQSIDLYIRYLTRDATVGSFDDLPIPFRALATDLESGDAVVFDKGDLSTALRASMAVPGVFDAVNVGGRILVDGMLARNLPISDIKGRCADVVIAIDVGEPLKKSSEIESWLDVLGQSINLGVNRNVREQLALLGPDDVLLRPKLGNTSATAFSDSMKIAETGRQAVLDQAESLSRFSLPAPAYQAWRNSLKSGTTPKISSIEVQDTNTVNQQALQQKLAIPEQGTSQKVFLEKLQTVFAEGDYDNLSYTLRRTEKGNIAAVTPLERNSGPNTLRFGLSLEGASEGDATFALLASQRRTWMNSAGGTWFNEARIGENLYFGSEFYQPLAATSPFFIAVHGFIKDDKYSFYTADHQRLADFSVSERQIGVAGGVTLGKYGEWRTGLFRGNLKTGVKVGAPELLPDADYSVGGIESTLTIDQFDNPRWPRKGYALRLNAQRAIDAWTDSEFSQLTTFDSNFDYVTTTPQDLTLRFTGKFSGATGDDSYIAPLGGFLNLSGYQNDELLGQRAALARVMAYWRAASLPSALGTGIYLGGSLEAGRIWGDMWNVKNSRWLPAGSVFVGADSLIGPLFIGAGYGKGGRLIGYFYLGADY